MTVKQVKKKQKHQKSGTTRTVTKLEQQESFFNFFSPPDGECRVRFAREVFVALHS